MKVVSEGPDPLVVAIENAQRAVDSFGRYLDAAQALQAWIERADPCLGETIVAVVDPGTKIRYAESGWSVTVEPTGISGGVQIIGSSTNLKWCSSPDMPVVLNDTMVYEVVGINELLSISTETSPYPPLWGGDGRFYQRFSPEIDIDALGLDPYAVYEYEDPSNPTNSLYALEDRLPTRTGLPPAEPGEIDSAGSAYYQRLSPDEMRERVRNWFNPQSLEWVTWEDIPYQALQNILRSGISPYAELVSTLNTLAQEWISSQWFEIYEDEFKEDSDCDRFPEGSVERQICLDRVAVNKDPSIASCILTYDSTDPRRQLCIDLSKAADEVKSQGLDVGIAPLRRWYSLDWVLNWVSNPEHNAIIEDVAARSGVSPDLLRIILAAEMYWDIDWKTILEMAAVDIISDTDVLVPDEVIEPRGQHPIIQGPGLANAHIESLITAFHYLDDRYPDAIDIWDVAWEDWDYIQSPQGAIEAAATYTAYLQDIYRNGEPCELSCEDMAAIFEGYRRLDALKSGHTEIDDYIERKYGKHWFFQNYLDRTSLLKDDELVAKARKGGYYSQLEEFANGSGVRANAELAMPFVNYYVSKCGG